jgi:SNF2 family DNA or RNA helicase
VHHAARFLGQTNRQNWVTPRIGLSGTPIINGFADIVNIGAVLCFPKRFTNAKFFDNMTTASGIDFVTTCFIKHFKSETIDLPELVTELHRLPMSDEERDIHKGYVSALNVEVINFNERRCTTFADVIVALVRLRQVAIHPDLPEATRSTIEVDGRVDEDSANESGCDDSDAEYDDADNVVSLATQSEAKKAKKRRKVDEAAAAAKAAAQAATRAALAHASQTWQRSTKLRWLSERADEYKQQKRPFLVFTSFSTAALLVREMLTVRGFRVALFIGSTTDGARREAVRTFQRGEIDALVLTYGAGGTGLHLAPAGAAVVHLDAAWTPAAHEQAECRLHRYGTQRDVRNDYVALKGSVDEYIYDNVHVKKQAYANALDRIVQHVSAKPVKANTSAVNMAQVLSLLRWFASQRRAYDMRGPQAPVRAA